MPLLTFALAACGSDDKKDSSSSADPSSPADPGTDPGSDPSGFEYKAINLPDWITNDGCKIFAWVWSPNNEGSWLECTYEPDVEKPTYVTIAPEEELTGFVLARCQYETTTPNWEETADVAGKVYNKTSDITCTAGTYEYDASSWVEAH